jgi:hypothetical protein
LQAQKGPFQRGVLLCQMCNLLEDTCTKEITKHDKQCVS